MNINFVALLKPFMFLASIFESQTSINVICLKLSLSRIIKGIQKIWTRSSYKLSSARSHNDFAMESTMKRGNQVGVINSDKVSHNQNIR